MIVDNNMIKEIGINPSVLYSFLKGESNENRDFFICSKEKIISETKIKRGVLNTSLKKLQIDGYIEIKVIGLPATTHFKITK